MSDQIKRPIGIDLFAGAGGLSLGFEQAGFDIAAAVEIDPIHCAVHEYNFPNCKTICASVADINGSEIRHLARLGNIDIDVVFGGAPCQGFSMIGKRALDDPRNDLVYHFVRLVNELKPRYFVFENVKGLTVGQHRQFLDEIIEAFGKSGYNVVKKYKVLNSAEFGVPQDRKRLFLLGARKYETIPEYPLPTGAVTVWEAISDLPEAEEFPELFERDWTYVEYGTPSEYVRRLRLLDNEILDYGYRRNFDRTLLTSSLRTVHNDVSRKRFSETPHGQTEAVSRFFKLDPTGLCNTLRAGTGSDRGAFTSPRPIHPFTPRCITVREAARLHSYPDWFRFHVTKWHGFRQVGNSVPPLLAKAVARQIIEALGIKPQSPTESINTGNQKLLSLTMAEAAILFQIPFASIPKRRRIVANNEVIYA